MKVTLQFQLQHDGHWLPDAFAELQLDLVDVFSCTVHDYPKKKMKIFPAMYKVIITN